MTVSSARVEEVFNALMDGATDQRLILGEALCASDTALWREVKSLLNAADDANGFLSLGADDVEWLAGQARDPDSQPGQRLGAYEIVRELATGGMGVVFLAKRVDGHYQQQVAIKMIRIGLASEPTLRRFHAERQFLAHLQHPNIAQLLDGGTSADGHPYLVMEYIQGEAIDTHCSANQLSVEQILLLMGQICSAVQYAHQNLLVHCDLKPRNILVTSTGVPKLLDFGIATLLQPTEFDPNCSPADTLASAQECVATPFTPEFAAPEQLRGLPITTAADVYSLGVVLYRLLSREAPYKISVDCLQDIANTIANIDIPLPSTVAPQAIQQQLRGDLDSLVLKALHKDPAQRYSSVQELADDIDRYLTGHPISATKSTWLYRSKMFTRRHRLGLGLSVLTATSLLAGSVISTWQWQIAQKKQIEAQRSYREIQELTSMVVVDIPKSITELPGSTPLREQMIRKGVTYLDNLAKTHIDSPELLLNLATAYYDLARVQGMPMMVNLGDPELALNNIQKSISIQQQLLIDTPDNLNLILKLAASYMFTGSLYAASLGNLNQGHKLTEQCLTLVKPFVDNGNTKVLKRLVACYTLAAHWHNLAGHITLATQNLRSAEQVYSDLPVDHPFVISTNGHRLRSRIHEEWAEVETQRNHHEQALQHERRRLEISVMKLQNHNHTDRFLGGAYHGLAARLATVNQLIEAQDAYEHATAHWANWQQDHPADVSGTQALIAIQAELAELHWEIANSAISPARRAQAVKKSCVAYANSKRYLKMLPENQIAFPTRYSWSPDPATIVERYEYRCQ